MLRRLKHHALPRKRLRGEGLERREVLANNFTALEQYLLELVNLARANPLAAAARYGLADLNSGLDPGTITADAKQPLAPQDVLRVAALGHSQDMFNRGFFDHVNPEGQGPGDRAIAAGYSFQLLGENLAYGNYGSITAADTVERLHGALINSPGHRKALFTPVFEELGIGIVSGVKSGESTPRYYITEEFGNNGGPRYLTGVVYTDQIVDDNFYSVGEGLANITITARSGGQIISSTTTGAAGGYALPLATGTYQITVTGPGLLSEQFSVVTIGSQNVKADFVRTPTPNLAYFIQESFESLLGRTPSAADVQSWMLPASYSSLRAVLNGFVASEEYFAKGGSLSAFVVNAYRDLLGRSPNSIEINNWLGSFASGLTRGAFAGAVTSSAEFASLILANQAAFRGVAGGNPDGEQVFAWTLAANNYGPWLTALYDDLLNRSITTNERLAWSKALADGATRGLVVDLFLRSPEHLRAIVGGYYQSILGRTATPGEIDGWAGAIAAGLSPDVVQARFYASAEFFNRAGGTTDTFVGGLYQGVLHRTASPGEVSGWVQSLTAGTLNRESAALAFLTSAEARSLLVDGWYRNYLNRPADAGAISFWTGYIAATSQHLAQAIILTSPEYRSLAASRV